MTQQFHSLVFTLVKWKLTFTEACFYFWRYFHWIAKDSFAICLSFECLVEEFVHMIYFKVLFDAND